MDITNTAVEYNTLCLPSPPQRLLKHLAPVEREADALVSLLG
jgi:hypothetical protein